ncbi:GDYXXLXY domain-containing protein [Paenibacillus sp. LHD-38]|uniref:GDYXXLXY domain-containing protein n=1 Tax=Paenibacillus sp. LHD-38 TaxID=3072143 RepID=UPI00280D86AE|nr:GDYXXLXY domain-containing protein [Paenibacillus sp. LHD-38]MDQ8738197.1 GDYXXLXY domain-containing protein [Paenibacillus sp. LHD-38]
MLRLNVTRVGFLMGVSLLLASIIYFFAANWGGLARADKILASAGIMVLFYGASFVFSKMKIMLGHHSFLSAIFLVGGCISFGVAVALLNQIYNSHADNYELFLVWSIPALLLAFITRFNPFFVLAYTLVHLMLWQYFFPSSLYIARSDNEIGLIGCMFALINLILFAIIEAKRFSSAPLKFVSFIVFHISLLYLTNSTQFELFGPWMNIVSVAAIAIGFYYFIKVRLDKAMLTLNALAASAFAVFKFLELLSEHASTTFFVLGLLFVAVLLTGNFFFFRFLNKLDPHEASTDKQEEILQAEAHHGTLVGKIVSATVTVIGVLIGSISLVGLVFLASDEVEPQHVLFVISLLFVLPMLLLPRLNAVIRYTVLTIGYAAGMIAIAWIDLAGLTLLFLAVTVAGWFRLHGRAQHFFIYSLINVNMAILLFQLFEYIQYSYSFIVIILTALNAVIYASHHLLAEGAHRRHLRECGLLFMLLLLFWLTFMEDIFPYSYELFNLINFIVVTVLAFLFVRRGQALEASVSLAFWFLYLAYKYYDLFWTLFHKSVTLALLGILAIAVTYFFAYRARASVPDDADAYRHLLRRSPILIAIVVALQLGYVGYHAATSEALLSSGTSVKLAIEPLDPRSLLQGDYVRLNYSISTPPASITEELEAHGGSRRIKVVLLQGDNGVYELERIYKAGESLTGKEIVMNGISNGWDNIYYGIETYFVPEGTGVETERNAHFAYVKVGTNGDALLERLSKD